MMMPPPWDSKGGRRLAETISQPVNCQRTSWLNELE